MRTQRRWVVKCRVGRWNPGSGAAILSGERHQPSPPPTQGTAILRELAVLEPLRRLYRTARSGHARLLHPWRRRRARARLAAAMPTRIVFVCTGNICRSPYAEAAARARRASERLDIGSAGLIGPDRPSPPDAIEAARARGLSLDLHRSRLLDRDTAGRADLLVVMDEGHAQALRSQFDVPHDR